MATELKGVWSLTEVKKSGEVVSKTASYKINNKEAIKLTNLSPSLTVEDNQIAGLTVDEDSKTLTLSGSALNKATVAFTSSTYKLELDDVPAVEFTDIKPTVASGKVTFKSSLSEGYTLTNGKTLTYSAAKTDPQELATVSGLATTVTENDVSLDEGSGVITLSPDALKQAKVSLSLKNGAAYTLAIDSDVETIETDGTWSVKEGTATLKGTVTQAGYAVAPDGKSVNYLKLNAKEATLATVKNLNPSYNEIDCTTSVDENGNYVITLPTEALNGKEVTLSGTGYALELDVGVPTSENVETSDEWTLNGTTATYNQIVPEHYDVSAGKIAYTKAATAQTYATLKGLKKDLKVSDEKDAIQSGTTNVITVSGNVIKLAEGALGTSNVTLTSDDFSLELDDVQEPVIDASTGAWSLSGKNGGVYKAKITTAGWGLKDSKTVTYTATSNSAVVGTITGLKTGVTVDELKTIEVADGKFTLPKALLTNTDVVLTNGNGFGYSLETTAPSNGEDAHSWQIDATTPTTAKLFFGKSAYYTASDDGTTLAYNNPVAGSSVATVQSLKSGITADDLPEVTQDNYNSKTKKYTIPLSADVLDKKTVMLTGTNYVLALKDDEEGELSAKDNQLIWELEEDKTAKTTKAILSNYKTEGWAPNSTGTQIAYTAPVTGATLATVEGFKLGLKTNEGSYTTVGNTRVYNNFLTGIAVYPEATKTIAIEKAAVGSGKITLTSNAGYKLGVGKDLVNSTATDDWVVDTDKATYTYTTPAGYSVNDTGTEFTAEKASKFTATLTGLTATNKNQVNAGVVVDNEKKVITLSSSVLGTKNVTAKGNYTLKLDSSVNSPVIGNNIWDMSKKGTAVLKGQVTTPGFTETNDTTITYTAPTDTSDQTLATVSGLNTTAGQTDTSGLAVKGDVITLSSNVLGTSKITIKSNNYKLALNASDKNIPTADDPEIAWVVKGTTATLQTATTGYYSMEKTKAGVETGAIIYNKPGSAKVHATVSGVAKDTTIDIKTDYNETTKTLTLKASQLGTAAKIELTDKDNGGYKLALASDVVKQSDDRNVTEWVRSGTKATYQTYTKGYYEQASDKLINYTKDGKATVHLTLNGVQGEAAQYNLNETDRTVTLNAEQLNQGKNKVTTKLTTSKDYVGYTIVLDVGVQVPSGDATWTVDGKGKANYVQLAKQGDFVNDGTTVTYYDADTPLTLATLSGLNTKITDTAFKDVTVSDDPNSDGKIITLTDDVLKTDGDKSTKVSVSTKGYTLAIENSLKPSLQDIGWNFKNLKSSGTAVFENNLGAGYVVDTKGTSVSYSAAKDANAFITLSGLNKNYSGDLDATAAGIKVDDTKNTVTLSNADLLTTSKITLKNGTGANYKLDVASALNPDPLAPETAVWTIKGTTATLNLGMSAGYQKSSDTTVDYVKEVANNAIATLTGLGKNAKVEGGQLGTITNKVFTQGVFIRKGEGENTYNIALTPEVLGTANVELTNTQGSGYTYKLTADNLTAPDEGEKIWIYDASKGTATLYQTTVAGWTLSGTNKLEYTPGKDNAALTTFSGLSKTFSGNIDEALNTPTSKNDTITVKDASLLGTSKASLKNATDYTYSLALGTKVPTTDTLQEKQWLTSGAKASLKDYKQAYYTIDKGAIVYNKAVDVKGKLYAEVSGIKKDVDISGKVSGNVITLGADQLDAKTVTLTNKTVDSVTSEYTLALGSDATKATPATTATWVTGTGTTANLTSSISAGFTESSDGTKLTYTKDQPKAVIAVIKGVNKGALDGEEFTTSNTTIAPKTSNLSNAVTIDGKETYAFKFDSDYAGKITGAATADTITAAGNSVTIVAGAGNDSIVVTGTGTSINGGKGNDSIKSSGKENVFYYATGDGDDVIASFAQASDKIMTNAKAAAVSVEQKGSNAVITIGAGTNTEGTITLTGKGSAVSSISVVDAKGTQLNSKYAASSDVLLADDNYSMDAAALTDITDAFKASYTPYDFETGLDLVKKDSFTPVISYNGDK